MSELHRIRLHGPWEVYTDVINATPGRITMPGILRTGGWGGYEGMVKFMRHFGRPTNLGTGEIVQLAIDGLVGIALIYLNDEYLGEIEGSARFDVTEVLRQRNELVLLIRSATDDCGITGKVVLEIVDE